MALHKDLTGADLHEVKGASAASAGQVLKASGSGTTSFVNPNTLTNITFSSYLTAKNSANILPAALDTPISAGFDSNVSNSDVSINSSGTITILTPGVYVTTFNFNIGRITSSGTADIVCRLLKNGSPHGFVQGARLSNNIDHRPMRVDLELNLVGGDVLQVQVMRDSSGVNEGGFIAHAVTPPSWDDIPSYWVRIRKILGAS